MQLGRDLDEARITLQRWLESRLDGAQGVEVSPLTAPGGAGFTNETLFLDAAWTEDGASRQLRSVLRVAPTSYSVAFGGAAFFEPQCRLMQTLASETDVPVPAIRWYEPESEWLGAPFAVTERVDGDSHPDFPPYNVSGWLFDASPNNQARMFCSTVETIARINTIDWRAHGLDYLLDPDRGAAGFEQRFQFFRDAYDWARGDHHSPILEQARDWLAANQPTEPEPVVLSWGDARPGNMIYRDFTVAAVIDWEFASLGPPLQDLSWWFFVHRAMFADLHTGDPDDDRGLPGFPSRAAAVKQWEELTGFSGENLHFYEVFSGFRLALASFRMGRLFIEMGVLPADSRWADYNAITQALAGLIGVEHPEPEQLPQLIGG